MALTPKGYTTKAEVEDYLFSTLDPAYDAALDDLIAKAESHVERVARRTFDQPAGPLVVPGSGADVILIPDTRALTEFSLDSYANRPDANTPTVYESDDQDFYWVLEPVEAPNRSAPYTRLRLIDGYVFPSPGKVTLTGTFGWEAVPAEVRMATTILVGAVTRRWREQKAGDVQSFTLGQYSVTYGDSQMSEMAGTAEWRKYLRGYIRPRVRSG